MSTRRTLTTTLAALALATPATALAATSHSATSHPNAARWASTHTGAFNLNRPSLGAMPASTPMRISVGLAVRHKAKMDRLAQAASTPGSSSFEHFLTPAQVRSRFGPTAASVTKVQKWLRGAGFTHVSAASNGLLVDAQAPAATVEKSFNTSIEQFRISGARRFANVKPAMVPASLSGIVTSVLGLSDLQMSLPLKAAKAKPSSTSDGSPVLTGFTPTQIAKIYDATSLRAAKKTSVAIIAMGDMKAIIKNLRTAETAEHYKKVPVKIVYGAPKKVVVTNNPLSGNAEWDLDTQISTMEAKAVKTLYIYDEQTFTDEDVARGINQFVAQDKATTGSASLGECDYIAWVDGAMVTTDQSLEEGALQGQTMFASTGDNGSFCPEGASTGAPGGGPGTSWPAEGTWTTAAGGTTVIADSDGNVTDELAWVGGGGGITALETAGDWTIPANAASQLAQYANQGGRSVPDISADADENTPVLIYTGDKTPQGVGGTSVSAPLISGLWARIQGVHKNKLGVASIRFYGLYDKANPGTTETTPIGTVVTTPTVPANPVPGLRDVVIGDDGLYAATPGYDYTTGVGTPLAAQLAKLLK